MPARYEIDIPHVDMLNGIRNDLQMQEYLQENIYSVADHEEFLDKRGGARRLCCPPSPYHGGYASAGRLAGRGASTLSVHDLFRNGPLDAGGLRYQTLATFARSLPSRSPDQQPRSTGRLADPPASPRVLGLPAPSQRGASWAEQAEGGGRSEVKRSRAGPPHGEPPTAPPPRPRSRSGRPRQGTHVGGHDNGRSNAWRMRGGTGWRAQ